MKIFNKEQIPCLPNQDHLQFILVHQQEIKEKKYVLVLVIQMHWDVQVQDQVHILQVVQ